MKIFKKINQRFLIFLNLKQKNSKKLFFLTEIIFYAFVSRFWLIKSFPPLINSTFFTPRIISSSLNVGIAFLVYFYALILYHNQKLALMSSLVFILLPWSVEQGRMASSINDILFVFLIFLIFLRKSKKMFFKILLFIFCFLSFFFFYPQFWILRTNQILSTSRFLNNFFHLFSGDFLFFENPTFGWSGLGNFGILPLSFSVFFILGIYEFTQKFRWEVMQVLTLISFISIASPFFPESQDFFLATPFLSLITALGLWKFFSQKWEWRKLIFSTFFLLLIYDLTQFWHYYFIHYSQKIIENLPNITKPF